MTKYVLVLVPLAAGLALGLVWQSELAPNPVLVLRVDTGTLAFLLGILVTILGTAGLVISAAGRRQHLRAEARNKSEQADAWLRFIRRLDHELKNPLTAIRAGLASLGSDGNAPTLATVRTQVDRLARLTADLRKLADLETQPVEQEPVDLEALLTEVVAVARERPEANDCRLRLGLPQAPWPLPPVSGDRDLLFLAMHNLVDNAIKFSRPEDTIEIRAFEDGPSVAVQVADTGPGVSEQDLPHLGEELYRGSGAHGIEGSGMGLALVHAIVKRHNGTITIRSRIAQGTVVTLRFRSLRDTKS